MMGMILGYWDPSYTAALTRSGEVVKSMFPFGTSMGALSAVGIAPGAGCRGAKALICCGQAAAQWAAPPPPMLWPAVPKPEVSMRRWNSDDASRAWSSTHARPWQMSSPSVTVVGTGFRTEMTT